jgi:hypothetical protein
MEIMVATNRGLNDNDFQNMERAMEEEINNLPEATKVTKLPWLMLTRVVDEAHPNAIAICHEGLEPYYVAPLSADESYYGMEFPEWTNLEYPDFPIPLSMDGVPWAEAIVYLLDWLLERPYPSMGSADNFASDLAVFRHFLDSREIDWMSFPKNKLKRPTYRFSSFMKKKVDDGANLGTSRRRISTVVKAYRWAIDGKFIRPEYEPWKEKRSTVRTVNSYGKESMRTVISTDLQIYSAPEPDPDFISDGGKLRPLEKSEQRIVIEALRACENTEVTLMHVYALVTGARLQTVCTLRVKHIRNAPAADKTGHVRILAGPGTGIDTKMNKRGTLFFPGWLIEKLKIYVDSPRAKRRRALNGGGDTNEQLVFLTPTGEPYYSPKVLPNAKAGQPVSRRRRAGRSLHQYIVESVIPQTAFFNEGKPLQYNFHWLRASFGMNYLDSQLNLVQKGLITLTTALDRVRERMWHTHLSTTLDYMKFRERSSEVAQAQSDFEDHLKNLTDAALKRRKPDES